MYKNYGDVNFLEDGMLVERDDRKGCFNILFCYPYSDVENLYQFGQVYIDVNDSWINKKAVESYCVSKAEDDEVQYAISCLGYYGPDTFGVESYSRHDWRYCNAEFIKNELRGYDIENIEKLFSKME